VASAAEDDECSRGSSCSVGGCGDDSGGDHSDSSVDDGGGKQAHLRAELRRQAQLC
jgi:hypothetical protein